MICGIGAIPLSADFAPCCARAGCEPCVGSIRGEPLARGPHSMSVGHATTAAPDPAAGHGRVPQGLRAGKPCVFENSEPRGLHLPARNARANTHEARSASAGIGTRAGADACGDACSLRALRAPAHLLPPACIFCDFWQTGWHCARITARAALTGAQAAVPRWRRRPWPRARGSRSSCRAPLSPPAGRCCPCCKRMIPSSSSVRSRRW